MPLAWIFNKMTTNHFKLLNVCCWMFVLPGGTINQLNIWERTSASIYFICECHFNANSLGCSLIDNGENFICLLDRVWEKWEKFIGNVKNPFTVYLWSWWMEFKCTKHQVSFIIYYVKKNTPTTSQESLWQDNNKFYLIIGIEIDAASGIREKKTWKVWAIFPATRFIVMLSQWSRYWIDLMAIHV